MIPPAVEPGDPPMSISAQVRRMPPSESWERSTVLKPAVRTVTDWNRAKRHFCQGVPWAKASPFHSSRANSTAPPSSSTPEVTSTSLLLSLYRRKESLFSTISAQT